MEELEKWRGSNLVGERETQNGKVAIRMFEKILRNLTINFLPQKKKQQPVSLIHKSVYKCTYIL